MATVVKRRAASEPSFAKNVKVIGSPPTAEELAGAAERQAALHRSMVAEQPSLADQFRQARSATPELPSLATAGRKRSPFSTVTPTGIAAIEPHAVPWPKTAAPADRGSAEKRLPEAWGITIDPEFDAALRSPHADELAALRNDLLARGCLDPLIVWYDEGIDDNPRTGRPERVRAPTRTLLDGHNRYRMCREHGIPVAIVELSFSSRAEAMEWIFKHQAGRRNLTPEERDALLAKDYVAEIERRKAEGKRQKAEKKAPGKNGAQREPANASGNYETVGVPFSAGHGCKAAFTLLERDGKWYHFEKSENAVGGGVSGYMGRETLKADVKLMNKKSFCNRYACLIDAADGLLSIAEAQGKKCWPAAALKELREWRASLPDPKQPVRAKKAADVVADRHNVSPATVKRAAKDARERTRIANEGLLPLLMVADLSRGEVEELAALSDKQIRDQLAGGVQAWRNEKQKAAQRKAQAEPQANLVGTAQQERELRREAAGHITRYLETLEGNDAWLASGYLIDAVYAWRKEFEKPTSRKKAKPR